jgi:hypothetical protein
VRSSTEVRVYEPDADLAEWEGLYDRFLEAAGLARIRQEVTS